MGSTQVISSIHKTKADILTIDEIYQLLDYCKKTRERAIIAVLYDSAARLSEFTNLKIGDVVFEGTDTSICVDGKTGQRVIPLNFSVKYLLEYLEEHPYRNQRDSSLWISQKKKGYVSHGMATIIRLIARRSKIQKRVHAH